MNYHYRINYFMLTYLYVIIVKIKLRNLQNKQNK